MIWVGIVLEILQALPTLIGLIQKIVAALHGHPLQRIHEHTFLGILSMWRDHKDPTLLKDDLDSLAARL